MSTQFPQWRDQHAGNNYPFADLSPRSNGSVTISTSIFLDAVLHPVGGSERMYLSQVTIGVESGRVIIGDANNTSIAYGDFSLIDNPDNIWLVDEQGRSAGVLVSNAAELSALRGFGVGDHLFEPEQTEFAAAVCLPMPNDGVTGLVLPDGEVLTGDVWVVGEDGVVLSYEQILNEGKLGRPADNFHVIRVNVVGDPLFLRRLCDSTQFFTTPNFIKTVVFTDGDTEVESVPDAYGNINISVNSSLATDTVLRVRTTSSGVQFEAVGAPVRGVSNT